MVAALLLGSYSANLYIFTLFKHNTTGFQNEKDQTLSMVPLFDCLFMGAACTGHLAFSVCDCYF